MSAHPTPWRRRPSRGVPAWMSFATAGLAVLVLAGCAADRDDAARTSESATTRDAAAPGPAPVVLPASSQRVRDAARVPGARAVVLNAWATWCAPCREEFPDLVRLERTYRDRGVRVVLLS